MNITPEVIEALRKLRMHVKFYADISSEFNCLNSAGIFAEIDREKRLLDLVVRLDEIESTCDARFDR